MKWAVLYGSQRAKRPRGSQGVKGCAYALQGPRGSRGWPIGSQGLMGRRTLPGIARGELGVLWRQEGCLRDPLGPSGWFDESSDDSLIKHICLYTSDPDLAGPPEVVPEVLAIAILWQ